MKAKRMPRATTLQPIVVSSGCGCCWETFYIFAYCGLVENPYLTVFFFCGSPSNVNQASCRRSFGRRRVGVLLTQEAFESGERLALRTRLGSRTRSPSPRRLTKALPFESLDCVMHELGPGALSHRFFSWENRCPY